MYLTTFNKSALLEPSIFRKSEKILDLEELRELAVYLKLPPQFFTNEKNYLSTSNKSALLEPSICRKSEKILDLEELRELADYLKLPLHFFTNEEIGLTASNKAAISKPSVFRKSEKVLDLKERRELAAYLNLQPHFFANSSELLPIFKKNYQNLETNIDKIVKICKEEELLAVKNKLEELKNENSYITTLLVKKEQELNLKNQEKEDMEASILRVKQSLEKKEFMYLETKQKLSDLENTISALERRITDDQEESLNLGAVIDKDCMVKIKHCRKSILSRQRKPRTYQGQKRVTFF